MNEGKRKHTNYGMYLLLEDEEYEWRKALPNRRLDFYCIRKEKKLN
jgi:hypothetical protein